MYEQIEKSKENENRVVDNSAALKKSNDKQGFGFVDNRSEVVVQRKLQEIANKSPQNQHLVQLQKLANNYTAKQEYATQRRQDNVETIQLKTVTVRNKKDSYNSGWQQRESLSSGVDNGPQGEAARVESIAGGTWVGGHMVNDRLGGTGGFSNIVPITSSMNARHRKIENQAQNKVGGGFGPYEVKYYMNILKRKDFKFGNNDVINNLPIEFKQSYDYKKKKGGPTTSVQGQQLNMFNTSTLKFT